MEKWQRVEAIKEFRVFTANSMFLPGRLSESRLAGADLKYKNTSRIQKTNHWQSKLCIWICRISSSSQQPQTKTSFCRFHFNAGKKGILGGGTWCYLLSLLTCRNLELLSELVVKLKVTTKDTTPERKKNAKTKIKKREIKGMFPEAFRNPASLAPNGLPHFRDYKLHSQTASNHSYIIPII